MAVVYGGLPTSRQDVVPQTPLVSFGIFSDVQFNCQPNNIKCRGWRVRQRYNQTTIEQLHAAVEDWATKPVSFLVNLGDLTEVHTEQGYNRDHALQEVLCVLNRIEIPKYHTIGHHDLKQFTRTELIGGPLHSGLTSQNTETPTLEKFYYHFSPCRGVRIVVLDLYEIALIGYADQPNNPNLLEARRLVAAANPNSNPRHCENMPWQHSKYTSINGGCSAGQLNWFREVLQCSQTNGETVIVCGHNPLCSTNPQRYSFVSWSNNEVLRIMYKFTCTQAYFGGHDGDGGYVQDDCGLHHITLPGIVETPPDSRGHATVHVCADRLIIAGCGRVPSMTLFYCRRPLAAVQLPGIPPASNKNEADSDEDCDIIDKILDKMSSLSICGSMRKKKMAKMGRSRLPMASAPLSLPQAHIATFSAPGQQVTQVTPAVPPPAPPQVQVITPPPAPAPALLPKHHYQGCQCSMCKTCVCGSCSMFCDCMKQPQVIQQKPCPSTPSLLPRVENQSFEVRQPMIDIYGTPAPAVDQYQCGDNLVIKPNQTCGNNQVCGKPLYPNLQSELPNLAPRLQRPVQVVEPPQNDYTPAPKISIEGPKVVTGILKNSSPAYEVPFPGKITPACTELPPRPCPANCPPYQPLQAVTTSPLRTTPPQPQQCYQPIAQIVPQKSDQCGINCGCQQRQIEPEIQHIRTIVPSVGAHGSGQVLQNRHVNGTGSKPTVLPGGTNALPVTDNFAKTNGPIFI